MKRLIDILGKIEDYNLIGSNDVEINDMTLDSREVNFKSAFFAVMGTQTDGHIFIDSAIEKGASVIFCEKIPDFISENISYVVLNDLKSRLGFISNIYYDFPSLKVKLVGITGTNGKTTVATLLYRLAESLGYRSGLISTVENKIGNITLKSTHTTPDIFSINRLFRNMVDEYCEYVFMEVSSHAVDQNRIDGLDFDGGIFTNITHDHLDYHKTFKNYIDTKKKFFDTLKPDSFALINSDDKNGSVMIQNSKAVKKSYSLNSMADFKGKILNSSIYGLEMTVNDIEVHFKLTGKFNAYNLLSIYGAAILLGWNKNEVLVEMSDLNPASGRFHVMRNDQKAVFAIIDYAHTPDALANVLDTIFSIKSKTQRIISVFGAGGDRDKAKRPVMGNIAAKISDIVIVTSDNPRTENASDINEEIIAGIDKEYSGKVLSIIDRKEAIKTGLMLAEKGDIVLIAGKGHEDYQIIGKVKNHFSDIEVVEEIWNL